VAFFHKQAIWGDFAEVGELVISEILERAVYRVFHELIINPTELKMQPTIHLEGVYRIHIQL
jgi:hypothetical protein